jgi:Mrp family chromosome partitioning ATPase
MGEIADALRRSRTGPTPQGRDSLPAALEPGEGRARSAAQPAQRRPLGTPAREQVLEALSPTDPAIVLEGGQNVEACRHLAVRLRAQLEAAGARSVAIVSAMRDEGKTTVLCDLGLALASLSAGREVALVDLDLRNPSIVRVLNLAAPHGVEETLLGKARLEDVRVSVRSPALDIYPALAPQRSAHELLGLPSFGRLIAELEERYTTVLIDTPPALLVPDTNLILRHVDVCLPIARAGKTRARSFRNLVETLPRQQILAELLNDSRAQRSYGYYDYYGPDEEGGEAPRRRRSRASTRESDGSAAR